MKATKTEVVEAIGNERDYQNGMNGVVSEASVGNELVLLRVYLRKAEEAYAATFGDPDEAPTMEVIRKLAGICVRCMENHGAPLRK